MLTRPFRKKFVVFKTSSKMAVRKERSVFSFMLIVDIFFK